MCHLDKTSCSRYNVAAHFGMDAESAAEMHFGVNAGFAAAAVQKCILDARSVAVAAAVAEDDKKKCHVEYLGGWW